MISSRPPRCDVSPSSTVKIEPPSPSFYTSYACPPFVYTPRNGFSEMIARQRRSRARFNNNSCLSSLAQKPLLRPAVARVSRALTRLINYEFVFAARLRLNRTKTLAIAGFHQFIIIKRSLINDLNVFLKDFNEHSLKKKKTKTKRGVQEKANKKESELLLSF